MRRNRRLPKRVAPSQNLDSFLDIMTNTVGVLMFVSLFITLVAVQSSTVIRTPLLSKTNKSPHFFEVANGTVSYLDTDEVERQLGTLTDRLPTCQEPREPYSYDFYSLSRFIESVRIFESCIENNKRQLDLFSPQIDNYTVQMANLSSFSLKYERLLPNAGVPTDALNATEGEFVQTLNRLDPQREFVAFIVRPDSFATFRKAREIAWRNGFNVGWEPHKADRPIIFGSSGRSVGVQ